MFMTSLGSTYNDLVRVKYDGTIHQRGSLTIFVSSYICDKIMHILKWESHSGQRVSLTIVNNIPCVAVISKRTGKPVNDKCRIIKNYNSYPKCGMTPIEISDDWFHIGHQIISIT